MQRLCLASHAFRTTTRRQWPLLTAARPSNRPSSYHVPLPPTRSYHAAVIGGGITGLTAAYRLLQADAACDKITVYEKSPRLGGWLQSETVEVNGGHVVFEYGPRTLRTMGSSALPTLDLLLDLGLRDQLLFTSSTSDAALNRYIYYPDRLVQLPRLQLQKGDSNDGGDQSEQVRQTLSTVLSLFREPVFRGLIWGIMTEAFRAPPARTAADESVAAFVSRRIGDKVTDNLLSAVLHGIYAGDIDKLSAQTLLGSYRDLERNDARVLGSLAMMDRDGKRYYWVDGHMALETVLEHRPEGHAESLGDMLLGNAVMTLENGLEDIVRTLEEKLRASGKVEILTDTPVNALRRLDEGSDIMITYGNENKSNIHQRVIATAPAPNLAAAIEAGSRDSKRQAPRTRNLLKQHDYAVSVMVVNLYYDDPKIIPYRGFGYLIPRSVPLVQNPERALGVIFSSDVSSGQDTASGTKLTVMLGGHWWDRWSREELPDEQTGIEMARSVLRRHLNVTAAPTVARARLQYRAIPQYTVGHLQRIGDLSDAVREEFDHRLTLAGNWYNVNGVGVGDSIAQAYLAATYGVGARRVGKLPGPLGEVVDTRSWDLEGGIATAPVRYAVAPVTPRERE